MKAIALVIAVGLLAWAPIASAQGTPVYDQRYAGPMNMYGQPTYTVPQTNAGSPDPQQAPMNGVIPLAARGAQSVGSYLWSFMPAPVRGVEPQYKIQPGQGQVIVNFVPGNP